MRRCLKCGAIVTLVPEWEPCPLCDHPGPAARQEETVEVAAQLDVTNYCLNCEGSARRINELETKCTRLHEALKEAAGMNFDGARYCADLWESEGCLTAAAWLREQESPLQEGKG